MPETDRHWLIFFVFHKVSGCIGRLPGNNCEKGKNIEETERDSVDSAPKQICQMCFTIRQVSMPDRTGAL